MKASLKLLTIGTLLSTFCNERHTLIRLKMVMIAISFKDSYDVLELAVQTGTASNIVS